MALSWRRSCREVQAPLRDGRSAVPSGGLPPSCPPRSSRLAPGVSGAAAARAAQPRGAADTMGTHRRTPAAGRARSAAWPSGCLGPGRRSCPRWRAAEDARTWPQRSRAGPLGRQVGHVDSVLRHPIAAATAPRISLGCTPSVLHYLHPQGERRRRGKEGRAKPARGER